jgi:Protein of unknown function (DUF1453)
MPAVDRRQRHSLRRRAMQNQQMPYSWVIPFAVIALVLVLRWRRMGKARPLRLEYLWVVPAIYLALVAVLFWEMTPQGLGWLWAGLSLAAGAAIGWQRGRTMRIGVDPETHALNQTASPAAMLFIVALIAIRYGLREAALEGGAAWHLDAVLITDCLVAFALGLLSATRLEMYLRGRRLLNEARSGAGAF